MPGQAGTTAHNNIIAHSSSGNYQEGATTTMATQDGQAHSRSIGTVVPCAMPNDQPRTAAATAARRAGRLEKMAAELRLAGWTVTAPEGTTEFQCCTCSCTYPSTSRAYFGRVPPREGQHKPVGSICRYCAIDPTISMDWEAAL